ncbi:uncharacterized protein LOC126844619 [Adelges cooleyi]|uniref:uncharacterized protein LOC126844619 n=1 Tax=Adelges cooleyi TaxID=133065 RepID=UPI0021809372|nr:uncharacterized protein LOC126844619 [Adelges cooleyi]
MISLRGLFVTAVLYGLAYNTLSVGKPIVEQIQLQSTMVNLCKIQTGFVKNGSCAVDVPRLAALSPEQIKELSMWRMSDITCGFKLIALGFLKIVKHLFKWYNDVDLTKAAVDRVSSFGVYARLMLTVLYNIQNPQLYEWWLFYMFVADASAYRDRLLANGVGGQGVSVRLVALLESVTVALSDKKDKCYRYHHELYVTDDGSGRHKEFVLMTALSNKAEYDAAVRLVTLYESDVAALMDVNRRLSVARNNIAAFSLNRLYLNDGHTVLGHLQILYDNNVEWQDVNKRLGEAYDRAKANPMSIHDGLARIKTYQHLYLVGLKMIMCRITWTHAELLRQLIDYFRKNSLNVDTSWHFVANMSKCIARVLIEFAKYTGLTSDPDLLALIMAFEEQTKVTSKHLESVTERIRTILIATAALFGVNFDAVRPPVDKQELFGMHVLLVSFAKRYNLATSFEKNPMAGLSDLCKNCTRGTIFVSHVGKILRNVDFQLMRSLFKQAKKTQNLFMQPNEYGGDIV